MSVTSPRAYAAYARDVPAGGGAPGAPRSGSTPDSRPLRARVAVRLRLLVRLGELPHDLLAPVVNSLEPPLFAFGQGVCGGVGEPGGLVEIADHRAWHLFGVPFPPASPLRRPTPLRGARI